jgi:hydrogenase/urease accessory protein HupE
MQFPGEGAHIIFGQAGFNKGAAHPVFTGSDHARTII